MIPLSYIPPSVRVIFKGMPGLWKDRHVLIFMWLVLMQAIFTERKNLKTMALSAPSFITEWRFRRLLTAGYWSIHLLVNFFAAHAIASFPAPEDGILFLIADSSEKDKRGKKNPSAQKGKRNKNGGWFFGIRFIVLMAAWDVFRIPAAFRIILPKSHPNYQNENALFREMLKEFQPPQWAKTIVVLGDCAYASKENFKFIKELDKSDSDRVWGFVFGIAKTWKMKGGKSLRDLAYHLPKKYFQKTWIPKLPEERGRKTFRVFSKMVCLNHIGDVTIVLSKKGRNVGPQNTKILVTNLTGLTARQIIGIYNRRWSVEILFKELKTGLGLGKHQVTKNEKRIENSVGISIISCLFLLISCNKEINNLKSWSIFQLQSNFRMRIITDQLEHQFTLKIKNLQKSL